MYRPATVPSFTLEGVNFDRYSNKILFRLAELGVPLDYDNFLDNLHLYIFNTPNPSGCCTDFRPPFVNLLDLTRFYQTFLPRPARIALLPVQSVLSGRRPSDIDRRVYWQEPASCFVVSNLANTLPTDPKALSKYVVDNLGLKPIEFEHLFDPLRLIDWLQPIANRYVPAMQYLHLGDLPEFFVNLVYAGTYQDLRSVASYYDRFVFLVKATYGLPL